MAIYRASPELDSIVSAGQDVETLGTGFSIAEGPVWYGDEGYLLFSDILNNRRMKWAPTGEISVFRQPTDYANGLTRDPQGRLLACEAEFQLKGGGPLTSEAATRRVTRLEPDGRVTVVADQFEGTRFNRPNDVTAKSDGSVYFTDPGGSSPVSDLGFSGVYRVSPDLSTVTLSVRDFVAPNGLAFSPDESVLYIDDSRTGLIRAFDVQPDGTLINDRVFHELKGDLPGAPDGMKVDVDGNVYCTGPGGVWVLDSLGRHLGTILTGVNHTTNCAWGGDDWRTLFITTFESLARIRLNIPGVPVPRYA